MTSGASDGAAKTAKGSAAVAAVAETGSIQPSLYLYISIHIYLSISKKKKSIEVSLRNTQRLPLPAAWPKLSRGQRWRWQPRKQV